MMCRPSLSFFHRWRICSGCGFAGGMVSAVRLIVLLSVTTLLVGGCSRWAEPTVAISPVPLTPGAIVTTDWSYQYGGNRFTESGECVHLPAGEAGNLLLWIRSVEENTQ